MLEEQKPWLGRHFKQSKFLVLGESAYSWIENGELIHPAADHAQGLVAHVIDEFDSKEENAPAKFMKAVTRLLCGVESPSRSERENAWHSVAFANYVQGTVGVGAGVRPERDAWLAAEIPFMSLINTLKPSRCLVLGRDLWSALPENTATALSRDVQAYRLHDGNLMWCLAVPHPANRKEGFDWRWINLCVRNFRETNFPASIPSKD